MSCYTASPLAYPVYPSQDHYSAHFVTMNPPYSAPAPRPQLQVSTDYSPNCQDAGEYLVRDMFTPSPTSSSPSDHTSSVPPYTPEVIARKQQSLSATSPSFRREERRRGTDLPSMDEGLVVRGTIAHPYARLYSKKQGAGKRRKMWNHALEKMLFTPQEISTMGAPHRRTIYTASLEAHVDRLHEQLLSISLFPVPFEKLEPYRGLNSKTAKSMVSGLHHDAAELKLRILELERANRDLEEKLNSSSLVYKPCL
ncbi:hypothetical protein C8Q70DRAFT_975497 [Cubamyces menziesii]|nr:hypothetical protein C8Q70DRAFT_975497 [Cubamyces menziesii]